MTQQQFDPAALASELASKLNPEDLQKFAFHLMRGAAKQEEAVASQVPWFQDPAQAKLAYDNLVAKHGGDQVAAEAEFETKAAETKLALEKRAEAVKIAGDLVTAGRYLCHGFMDEMIKTCGAILLKEQQDKEAAAKAAAAQPQVAAPAVAAVQSIVGDGKK